MDVTAEGGVTVPVDRLIGVVEEVLDEITARAASELQRVVAVGISCFLHSFVGLGADGRPTTPVLSWADSTGAESAHELRETLDEESIRQRTGCPIHPSYWPARIRHLHRRRTEIAAVAGFPELLMERLTGERVVGPSLASATGLLDRRIGLWDRELLESLGVRQERLPRLVEAGSTAGDLVPDVRGRWPALARVPWFVPWGDAACSNVGLCCLGEDRAALVIGSSGALRVLLAGELARVPRGLFAFRFDDQRTLLGGQLSEGGAAVAWLCRLLGTGPRRLEALAAQLPPDGHGLTVLPFLAGERGPGYHADARGTITGLSLATTPATLYRATLESIALRFASLAARLEETLGHAPTYVASGGGLARSPLWQQIVADALGADLEISAVGESSSRGAALLALDAAGAIELDAVPLPAGKVLVPDRVAHQAYEAAGARQSDLYRRLHETAD
jgi:gluconokinase